METTARTERAGTPEVAATPPGVLLFWLAGVAARRPGVWATLLVGGLLAIPAAALPEYADIRLALFFWLHIGAACVGVALGRLLLARAGAVLVAQAPSPVVAWVARLFVLAMAATTLIVLIAWGALGFDPGDLGVRTFLGATYVVATVAFAVGAVLPRRPAAALLAPAAVWGLYYLVAATDPEAVLNVDLQLAFVLTTALPSLGLAWLAHAWRMRR